MEINWHQIELKIGELPLCIKKFLSFCAFNSFNTLKELNAQKISEIEQCVSEYGQALLGELDCCHSKTYKNQTTFRLLPGHRALLLDLPNHMQNHDFIQNDQGNIQKQSYDNIYPLLSELVKTAEENAHKSKHLATYSDKIRYFFTYIYLMSGRSCYETLYQNLPIPSIKTICE